MKFHSLDEGKSSFSGSFLKCSILCDDSKPWWYFSIYETWIINWSFRLSSSDLPLLLFITRPILLLRLQIFRSIDARQRSFTLSSATSTVGSHPDDGPWAINGIWYADLTLISISKKSGKRRNSCIFPLLFSYLLNQKPKWIDSSMRRE